MRSPMRTIGTVVLVAVLMGTAAGVQAVRESRVPLAAPDEETLYVTSGQTLRRLTAGYAALAADLYWIRAIQYYGGVKLRLDTDKEDAPGQAAREIGRAHV